ncbi:MAG: thioredoxin-dependent thiol peroxidase [Verrucomicrobia bacterium]|nr:thioredoxin-dependent thiol peroxidase [Verrucomicrobiota bacterium]
MSTLQVGDKAPSFTTTAVGGIYGSGTPLKLTELKGQAVVLYFYPKDDTPGCTTQACEIRDAWKEIQSTGAALFGVSIDPVKSHGKFIAKFDLPFPLLSDTDKSIVEAYGVWVEKSMYGKRYMGTERSTFIIDPKGTIAAIFPKVKPAEHAGLVVKALKELRD